MRVIAAVSVILMLAACEAPDPELGGVGFGDYDAYQEERARREAERLAALELAMAVSDETVNPVPAEIVQAQPAAEPELVPLNSDGTSQSASTQSTQTVSAAADTDNPDISDEQNFEAVSARESIESDAERLKRNREKYVVIEPTDLPRRPGTNIPNIVAYALTTTNSVGEPLYQRGPFTNDSVSKRNCARFVSDDLAQEAFLAAGGPKRDPRRLDIDGDGFACEWDPVVFRNIRN
jgi:hypothetical protein